MGNGLVITGLSLANESITPAMIDIDAAAKIGLGVGVHRASASLPASGTTALFNVVGGRVLLVALFGYITTVIQTQTCTAKFQLNPTAAGTSVDICATLDITAKAAFSSLYITGVAADAMLNGVAFPLMSTKWVANTGTIDLVLSATNTGAVQWSAFYLPIDANAYIEAA